MSEITQCFIASEPVSIAVFQKFTQLNKENAEHLKSIDTLVIANDKLKSKINRVNNRANKYLDRLQEAHKERDELKAKYKHLLDTVDSNWLDRDRDEWGRDFWDKFKLVGGEG